MSCRVSGSPTAPEAPASSTLMASSLPYVSPWDGVAARSVTAQRTAEELTLTRQRPAVDRSSESVGARAVRGSWQHANVEIACRGYRGIGSGRGRLIGGRGAGAG